MGADATMNGSSERLEALEAVSDYILSVVLTTKPFTLLEPMQQIGVLMYLARGCLNLATSPSDLQQILDAYEAMGL